VVALDPVVDLHGVHPADQWAVVEQLLDAAALVNLGRELGVDHTTAARRVRDLVENYLAWPCHQRGVHGFPGGAPRASTTSSTLCSHGLLTSA